MSTGDAVGLTEQLEGISIGWGPALRFGGRGLKLDSEEDVDEITSAIKSSENVELLDLRGNALGVDAAKAVGSALTNHPEFKRALWSDLFTGRLKTEILTALKYLCNGLVGAGASLVELDLSDNALGPNGMAGLVDFFKSSCCHTLQELRLDNTGLGPEGGKMLANSLLQCHESGVQKGEPLALRVFVSGRGRLEDGGAIALAEVFEKMQSLEEVIMPQNDINHEGISVLAEALMSNRNLRHLNLSDNTFTEEGSKAMAKAITKLKKLEVINFDDCLMRTDGAKALAAVLNVGGNHRKLKVLRLAGNDIGASGAQSIAEAMADKEELELLDLNANQLGDEGIESLRNVMENIGRFDQLASLSEDEGTEIEDVDEDEDDDDEIAIPEEDNEGEEYVGCGLEIRGRGITPRPAGVTESNLEDEISKLKL